MGSRPVHSQSDLGSFLPFGKALYRERVLAVFRLAASFFFVLLFPLIRSFTPGHHAAVRLLLFAYALASLLIMARIFTRRRVPASLLRLIQISDFLWPSLICLLTGSINSPFLLLFILVLLAAPYRGNALQTLAFTLSGVSVLIAETLLASLPSLARFHLLLRPIQPGSFAVRISLLLLLCGYLAYMARWTLREQQALATRSILHRLHADAGVQENVREILPALLSIFEARRVVLVLRNFHTWRVYQWAAHSGDHALPVCHDLPPNAEDRYFWPMPHPAWSMACLASRSGCQRLALDRDGLRIPLDRGKYPPERFWDHPFNTLLTTSLQFGCEWTARVFLIDPQCATGNEAALRLLHHIAQEVGPAVYNFYLWQNTSARVRSIERRRLARDLHDGVVQSLIATEMQLEVLRRQAECQDSPAALSSALPQAQAVIRSEVRKLRRQIEQLRSTAAPRQVLPRISGMLASFEAETGIHTVFSSHLQEDTIPSRISGELLRIVEEALSNVRKHSGANEVEVRLVSSRDAWEIIIQDDGRGFDFSGRLSLAELEAASKGPRVIRERVHSFNGELTLESRPNQGTRLEIRFAPNG